MTRRRDGFSLLELMTVVAILGVLAAVAIPTYLDYVRRAQSSEAPAMLASLYQSAASYYASNHRERSGPARRHCAVDSAGPLPAAVGPELHAIDFSTDPSFQELGFATTSPIRYSYEIVSVEGCDHGPGEALYSFRAHGDLDADGEQSLIEMAAGSSVDNVLMRSPGFYVLRLTE